VFFEQRRLGEMEIKSKEKIIYQNRLAC